MKKHYFLTFLWVLLLIWTAPATNVQAQALSGSCGRRIHFNDDSTNLMWQVDTAQRVLTITGSGRMYDYDWDTKGPWHHWRNYIDRLVLPDGLTIIGTLAMYDLYRLDSIQWGSTVRIIRDEAFRECRGLTKLTLPISLDSILTRTFYACSSMQTMNTGDGLRYIGYEAFNGCYNLRTIHTGIDLRYIDGYAFSSCSSLQTVDFGDSPVTVGYSAFCYPNSLKTVTGNRIKSIGSSSFYNCNNLETLHLGDSITSIESWAFYSCSSLRNLHLPATLTNIYGGDCFAHSHVLDTITVDPGNPTFNSAGDCNAVMRTSDNTLVIGCRRTSIPSSTKKIGSHAFDGCTGLSSVALPSGVTTIENNGFSSCYSLQSVSLPIGLTYMGNYAFAGCSSLQSIILPEGLTSLGSYVFSNCTSLQSIVVPGSLQSLPYEAFSYCSGLQSVTLQEGLMYIGSRAFIDCSSLQTVSLPNSVTSIDCDVFNGCSSLTQPIYNNKLFARLPMSYAGAYTIPDNIERICCTALHECNRLTSINCPPSVKSIGNYAFYSCDSLQSVTMPDSLNTLSTGAFEYCRSLTSINVPNMVTIIEPYTFHGCQNLQTVTLPDNLNSIGYQAFDNCRSLLSIIIPDPVVTINWRAFVYCSSLTSITFPANLTNLGENLLEGCTNLSTIIWNVRQSNSFSGYDYNHPFSGVRNQITTFTFGDSVQVLPGYLCYNMINLTSLSLGCNMDSIGEKVFDGCKNIKSIHWNARNFKDPKMYYETPFYSLRDSITTFTFGDSVRHIPAYLCHSMSLLHEVHIPKNVSSIGDYAFRYLGVLDSISVAPANIYYDSRGGCNALMETATNLLMLGCYKTQIPTNTEGIDACAFRNVRKLNTVNLPPSVTFIGKEAFNGCKDLKYLTLSKRIGAINDYAFQDCDSLYNITLPDSLWFIGLRAFANCSHIQTITLPENVEVMDQYAFSGCSSMRSITCNAPEPPSIQETTFYGTSCPIYVKCSSISAYRSAPVWQDFGTRVSGLFFNTLTVRPNDYSFGRVYIVQQPDCEHTAILEADPILGYKFVSWQDTLGNVLSLDTRYEFYLDEDKSIIAEFVRDLNALDDVESHVRIWVNEHDVMLLTELNTPARLYDLMGHEVDAATVEAGVETSLHAPNAGIYVVVTDNDKQKVIIK